MALAILYPVTQFLDAEGNPLGGGSIETYEAGTLTSQVAYQDSEELAAHPTTITLDSEGRAQLWLATELPPYKLVIKDSASATIETIDQVNITITGSSVSGGTITNSTITGGTVSSLASPIAIADGGTASTTASAARTALGLAIGTDVQAYDIELAALAGLTSAANKVPRYTGSGTADLLDFLDEDTMTSNSATAVASQQSIKAYVDTEVAASAGEPSDGDKGDITVSGVGTIWTIDSDAVTYDKIQDTTGTDVLLGRSTAGAGTVEEVACTAAGRALIDDADASAQRTTLGLGSLALQSTIDDADWSGADLAIANGGTGSSTAAAARTALGLAIGTDVQAYDAGLTSIAGLATVADKMIYTTASDTYATADLTTVARNFLDDTTTIAQRSTLGITYTAVEESSVASSSVTSQTKPSSSKAIGLEIIITSAYPATDTADLQLQLEISNSVVTSNYKWSAMDLVGTTVSGRFAASGTVVSLAENMSTSAADTTFGTIRIMGNPDGGVTDQPAILSDLHYLDTTGAGGTISSSNCRAYLSSNNFDDVTGFKFLCSSGNIAGIKYVWRWLY